MTFLRRDATAVEKTFNVGTHFTRKPCDGAVGIEVEVEGNRFPYPDGQKGSHTPIPMSSMKGWSYVHDGSLRGKDNAEYVLSKPISFDEVPASLETLYSALTKYGSVIDRSQRTSVHVHLNVQGFFLNRLTSLMALYMTFEEVLTEWCGEQRIGNLFCLRAKDAPAIVSQVKRFVSSDMQLPLKDHHRYAGMNVCAIPKLGSLEFRALRGVPEPSAIISWVEILRRLYDLSSEFTDPRDVCGIFSGLGPIEFFDYVLGDQAAVVRAGIDYDDERIAASMFEGIRMAQDVCYCRDWSVFRGIELQPDPFKRDQKKIMKKLVGSPPPVLEYDDYEDPDPEYDEPSQYMASATAAHAANQAQHAQALADLEGWATGPGLQWQTHTIN